MFFLVKRNVQDTIYLENDNENFEIFIISD